MLIILDDEETLSNTKLNEIRNKYGKSMRLQAVDISEKHSKDLWKGFDEVPTEFIVGCTSCIVRPKIKSSYFHFEEVEHYD